MKEKKFQTPGPSSWEPDLGLVADVEPFAMTKHRGRKARDAVFPERVLHASNWKSYDDSCPREFIQRAIVRESPGAELIQR